MDEKVFEGFFWRCSNKVEPICCFRFFVFIITLLLFPSLEKLTNPLSNVESV